MLGRLATKRKTPPDFQLAKRHNGRAWPFRITLCYVFMFFIVILKGLALQNNYVDEWNNGRIERGLRWGIGAAIGRT